MKKRLPITTFIISILIVVLSYFMYQNYIAPIYLNNKAQEESIDLSQNQIVTLSKSSEQKRVYSIELEFSGNSASNLSIVLTDSIGIPMKEIKLKKGEIDYMFQDEWYSSECTLTFSSKEKMKGELEVEYRFLGLK
ncbi:MAG: hypothetical protein COA33_015115 [Fluviicola sp.]|nr:hypothetical protein [Fluviicola sp.]